jgi:hypothetical protein
MSQCNPSTTIIKIKHKKANILDKNIIITKITLAITFKEHELQ